MPELPDWLPSFVTWQFIASVTVIVVILNIMLGAAMYLILLERKVCAWVQDRIGPNRVGPLGLLQPVADGIKSFLKEDFIPPRADRFLFILAPGLTVVPAMIGFAIIPWAGSLEVGGASLKMVGADVDIGIVYLIAVASLGVYGVALGGWASNNKFSFLGGLRASAQMVSYEIPMGLAFLTMILMAGTLDPSKFVEQQIAGPWNILQQPIAAILVYVCMLAEANRAPFDLAEAESELVGGWHTEYSSMKWALFFLGEYSHLFVGSAFFSVLFLGGWSVNPLWFGPDLPLAGGWLIILVSLGVMLTKVFLLVFLTMMVRWTLPRFRYDQLMRLAWEGMIPTAMLVLLVTSFFVYQGWTSYMWVGSLITLAVIWIIQPYMPRQTSPNHRLGLIGSRFSPLEDG